MIEQLFLLIQQEFQNVGMKRIMKQIVFLSICFSALGLTSTAQKKTYTYKERTPEEKARYFTKKMVDSLEVTAAQEDSLYLMNIELTKKFDSLRTIVDQLNRKERSAAYRSIYAYRDERMREILPRKEFLKFLDIEREKWERKKARKFQDANRKNRGF